MRPTLPYIGNRNGWHLSVGLARYYTEGNGPDPNMTPYYQSVPMAMWVTLLNLSGEAPLCDYTVSGKVSL